MLWDSENRIQNTVKMYTTKGKSNMSRQHISLYIIHFSLAKWQWVNLNLVLGNSDSSSFLFVCHACLCPYYKLLIPCLQQVSIIIQNPTLGHRHVATVVFPHPRAEDLNSLSPVNHISFDYYYSWLFSLVVGWGGAHFELFLRQLYCI